MGARFARRGREPARPRVPPAKKIPMHSHRGEPDAALVHVNVASPAGAYTVGNSSFFRYIVRMGESGLPLGRADREALDVLSAIPHAFEPDDEVPLISGAGWRVVPAQGELDWPVLEATPQRLRSAFECARALLWVNADKFRVSAREITSIEEELEAVYGVLQDAEAAGFPVNVSYVS
jgi:hypothetical protein